MPTFVSNRVLNLVWWKKGPIIESLINIDRFEDSDKIMQMQEYNAKGVIYELSASETFFVDTPFVEKKIKKIINDYK